MQEAATSADACPQSNPAADTVSNMSAPCLGALLAGEQADAHARMKAKTGGMLQQAYTNGRPAGTAAAVPAPSCN